MSQTIEQNLRAALLELAESRSTDADARLRAIDYRPRTARPLRWPLAGLAGAALAVAATAAVLLSSSAPEAFAGWSAVPAPPTSRALYAATVTCNALHPTSGRLTGTPVLAEARGKYTAAVYLNRSERSDSVCISNGMLGEASVSGGDAILGTDSAPSADQLGMPADSISTAIGFPGSAAHYRGQAEAWWSAMNRAAGIAGIAGLGSERDVSAQALVGRAGSDVRAVVFAFDRGVTVEATVEHGWYFAWWPGIALPNSVQVTLASGAMKSSAVPDTKRWDRTCPTRNGIDELSSTSSCGVFATGEQPQAIRRQRAWLRDHPHFQAAKGARGH